MHRYYLTQRPPSIGTHPKGAAEVVGFDFKQDCGGFRAWGYVEYDEPLSDKEIANFELREES